MYDERNLDFQPTSMDEKISYKFKFRITNKIMCPAKV